VLRKRGNLGTPTKRFELRVSETSEIASCYVTCSAFLAIDRALSALRQDNWVGEIGQGLTLDYREPSVPCGGFRDGLRTAFCELLHNVVERAVALDAAALVVNLIWAPDQPEIYNQCVANISKLKSQCEQFGLPMMVEPLLMVADTKNGGYRRKS
jgi:hypothetical protein